MRNDVISSRCCSEPLRGGAESGSGQVAGQPAARACGTACANDIRDRLGNHAHLIVEARSADALGRGMEAIGARLARAVNRVAKRSRRVVADRYHSRLLKTPREVHRALRYVLLNARKHAGTAAAAARAAVARLDPASSARWFDGWRPEDRGGTGRALTPLLEKPAVARARTWLLTNGWHTYGLLDPGDVPGRVVRRGETPARR